MHIGVIGLGYWGAKHLRVVSGLPEVDQVSAFDIDPKRTQALVAAFPTVAAADSVEQLLDRVDGVIIATHPITHSALALAALHLGCHVLVEKPLALDERSGEAVVSLAESKGLTLMVGHTFAYNPAIQLLQTMLRERHLGRVLHIESQRLNLGSFRNDCDVIWDLAPHDVSILTALVGVPPISVSCWGKGHVDSSVVDNAYIRLRFPEDEIEAVVHVSWLHPSKTRQVTVVGTERMAVYDDLAGDLKLRVYDRSIQSNFESATNEQPFMYRHGDIHCPYVSPQEPLVLEDKHFVECMETGRPPVTHGRSGLAVVRVLEAASKALKSGGDVDVPVESDSLGQDIRPSRVTAGAR